MKKNEIYEMTIEDMTEDGSGIGHVEGMAVFVKDTAVGDKAKVRIVKEKKNYAFGRLEELIEPSVYRIKSVCPVARQCGGCTLQHISYEKELELKKNRVLGCLSRIGGIERPEQYFEGIYGLDASRFAGSLSRFSENCYRYRNKMQFPVGRDKDGKMVAGFYAGRTHYLVPVDDCVLGHVVNKYVVDAVCSWGDKYSVPVYDEESGKGFLRHILTRVGFKTGELMVCLVTNGKQLDKKDELIRNLFDAVERYNKEHDDNKDVFVKLTSVVMNVNEERTNKILGEKTFVITGQEYITDYIGDIMFRISAQSFYQVNPVQTEKLYGKALEYAGLQGDEKVWDMYCGIGTISLFLSKAGSSVYGVEIVPQAIEDARKNAALNNISKAEFFVGKAEDVVAELYSGSEGTEKYGADVVVVDPPRKGCDTKLLETIISMAPKRMVYVSCDPATLARDLKILLEGGFKLEKVSAYDQFSRSMHVETVVKLSRG